MENKKKSCGKYIKIHTDGRNTIAQLYDDNAFRTFLGEAVARCHPDDEFDLATGAKVAIDRLFAGKESRGEFIGFRGLSTDPNHLRLVGGWAENITDPKINEPEEPSFSTGSPYKITPSSTADWTEPKVALLSSDNASRFDSLQLIHDLCIDYDGFNTADGLKSLIDDIRNIAEKGEQEMNKCECYRIRTERRYFSDYEKGYVTALNNKTGEGWRNK